MENKILDKIKKLLTLAKDSSATQNEVQVAIAMAEKLAIEHQINIDDIDFNINNIDYEYVFIDTRTFEPRTWIQNLCQTVSEGYNCEIIIHTDKHGKKFSRIIGYKEDVELCEEVIFTTKNTIRQMSQSQWLINGKGKDFRYSYITGFLVGLGVKLEQQRKEKFYIEQDSEKYSLIVKKKNEVIQDYIGQVFDNLKKGRRVTYNIKDPEAFLKGEKDGKHNYNAKHLSM